MSSVKDWFVSRREARARTMILRHSRLVFETVQAFKEFSQGVFRGRSGYADMFNRIRAREHEADVLRRRILDVLGDVNLPPEFRESLARLVRQVDWIADWAFEASRLLRIIDPASVPQPLADVIVKMIDKVLETARKTDETIRSIFDDPVKALDLCDQVERLEEEVDEIYQEFRRLFIDLGGEMSTVASITLFHAVDAIENTADRCEDTCDRAREFLVMQA